MAGEHDHTATPGAPNAEARIALSPEEQTRADFYAFLSGLLAHPPSEERLDQLAQLEPTDTEIGRAIAGLGRIAGRLTAKTVRHEFHDLFIGLGRGELMPYGSYYMTGFLNEKPLAILRQDMARLRVERTPTVFEPEDNIATLCEVMAGLIDGRFGTVQPLSEQKTFFNRHIAPWAPHFFADLEKAKNSVLYAPVGMLGRTFMEIEREAFRMEG
ncbi:MAG: molecular chaperone TorD family protein [Pseudomonadota bacterium]